MGPDPSGDIIGALIACPDEDGADTTDMTGRGGGCRRSRGLYIGVRRPFAAPKPERAAQRDRMVDEQQDAQKETGPHRLRVVNLGLPKSGTTTLGVALTRAGLRVADWRIRKPQTDDPELVGKFVGKLLYDGYFATGDPLHHMDAFDAFTEIDLASHGHCLWPQCDWGLIDAIRRHHPGARFLLSYRDPGELVDSMMRWSNLGRRRLPQHNVPGLPTGYGRTEAELIRWIEGHYAFCRRVFAGSGDFLEYRIADPDAPARIGAFIDRALPWWGKSNIGGEGRKVRPDPGPETETPPAVLGRARPDHPVYVHAGAHRTGTGSFQLCLAQNRDELSAHGFSPAYPARDDVPGGGLRLKLPGPRHEPRQTAEFAGRARDEISRHLRPDGALILSEGGLPGRMLHFFQGQFYPAAGKRAQTLAAALPAPPEHLVLVLRSYDGFYLSCYRNRAENHQLAPFETLKPGFMAMQGGWPGLIGDLRDHLRPRRFTVIDHAARGDSLDLLTLLVPGLDRNRLTEPSRRLNASATDAALEARQRGFRADQQGRQVASARAGDDGVNGFAEFTAPETGQLRDLYASDLARIAAMQDVTLVTG